MTNFILFLWQLPQNVIGLIYLLLTRLYGTNRKITVQDDDAVVSTLSRGGGSVSLGKFIFISSRANSLTLSHELGHYKQSKMLGPLYLLVIGIPSICWAGLRRWGFFRKRSYYSFYPESWADKLGGINRELNK